MSARATAIRQQERADTITKLPAEFVAKLEQRSCGVLSYLDFICTAGEFIVVRDGRVDENDPQTRMARSVVVLLNRSAANSKAPATNRKKLAAAR